MSSLLLSCYIVEMSNTDGKLVRQGDGRTGIDPGALACWQVRDVNLQLHNTDSI